MAKLERVTAKVFASDAPADKIGQFGSALAGTKLETGDVSTIQALPAYTEGWSSAVISQRNYPVLQETNGVMKNMTYQTAYIMQNGIAEYDPNTEYYTGSICKGIGNTNQYASWGDENVGNAVTNSDYWKNVTPVNYSNITNCLLEVPQRIKYDLTDGTLTIKAGTVVIVPYGTEDLTSQYPVGATFINDNFKVYDTQYTEDAEGNGKFFVWAELQSDLSHKQSTTTITKRILSVNISGETDIPFAFNAFTSSETTAPPTTKAYQWYDTTNNKCVETEQTTGNISISLLSLPIGVIAANETEIFGSIDQVFNGFGYIGSTVWVDKGVKGLIPNGRNEDGTLNNIEVVQKNLSLLSAFSGTYNRNFWLYKDGQLGTGVHYSEQATPPTIDTTKVERYFNTTDNFIYYHAKDETYWVRLIEGTGGFCLVGTLQSTDDKITSFNPKQPFRAVDYSEVDGSWVSSLYNIASDVTIANATTLTYDLSSYLPKDSNAYEVYLGIFAKTGNANGNSIEIRIGSSIATIDAGLVCAAQTRAANFITASGIVTIPVGSDKIITVKNSGNASGTISLFRAGAYRRLGM